MNISKFVFAVAITGTTAACTTLYAQDENDAYRYSNTSVYSTARSMGIGGAVGALGADFSSLSVNPAGIGVYRRSEFTFTPSVKINNSNSSYLGVSTADNASQFSINNLGVVFTSAAEGKRYERSKWKATSFGIGINRIADFNQNYTYKGFNNTSSGAEVFSIDANKYPNDVSDQNASGTLAYMGYQSFLLDTLNGSYIPVVNYLTGTNQQRIVSQKGGMNDIAISFGGNYDEKLMIGATIGIPTVRYKREITYSETDATNKTNNYFDNFKYTETLSTKGSGVNLKLGFIYKPVDAIRFGVGFHTPTYFNLKDEQSRELTTNTENFKADIGNPDKNPVTTYKAPVNLYEYNFISPWRTNVSAAALFGKYGFFSVDYEYVAYGSARYSFDVNNSQYQSAANQNIKNMYKGGNIVRLGLEGKIEMFSVRLGFGYQSNPYKNTAYNGEQTHVSGGIGFRFDNVFLDLGMVHTLTQSQEQPYTFDPSAPGYANVVVPTAVTKYNLNNVALTFGVKF